MDDDLQTQARSEGYSWDEIGDHVAQASAAATEEGYTQGEIDQHLGYRPAEGFEDRSKDIFTNLLASAPDAADATTGDNPVIDLNTPSVRDDYALELSRNGVKGPRDFADGYALGALKAAHGPLAADDSNPGAVDARQRAAARSADELARQLPSSHDVTDAALSLGGDVLGNRQNIIDHWQETGQEPLSAALAANNDPDLRAKLTTPPSLKDYADYTVNGIKSAYEGYGHLWDRMMDAILPSRESIDKAVESVIPAGELLKNTINAETVEPGEPLYDRMDKLAHMVSGVVAPELPRPQTLEQFDQAAAKAVETLTPPKLDVYDPAQPPGTPPVPTPSAEVLEPAKPAAYEYVAGPRVENPIEAYHASPHDFTEFSSDKIDTGEGSQQEGHGLYFAENPDVHEAYKAQFSPTDISIDGKPFDASDPAHVAAKAFSDAQVKYGGRVEAAAELRRSPGNEEAVKILESGQPIPRLQYSADRPGNSYKVNLHVDPNLMLHRDQLISEQSPEVQQAVRNVYEKALTERVEAETRGLSPEVKAERLPGIEQEAKVDSLTIGDRLGGTIQDEIRGQLGEKEASEALQKEGLHGIKYFDSGSLGHQYRGEDPTHNYVIFHDKRIQLTEKNGLPVAEDATPSEKLQTLSRDAPPHEGQPDYYQKLAKDEDPATQALAQGYDTAAGFPHFIQQLMWDEKGSLNLFKTPQQRAEAIAYKENNDFIKQKFIEQSNLGQQDIAHFASNLFQQRKLLDPHVAAYKAEILKGPAGNWKNTLVGRLDNYMESRSMGGALPRDNPLGPVADAIRDMNNHGSYLMKVAENQGIIDHAGWWEDYASHAWENQNGANQMFYGKQGTSSHFQNRTIPTTWEGLDRGLVPRDFDPIDRNLKGYAGTVMYIRAATVLKESEDAGKLYWASKAANDGDMRIEGIQSSRVNPGTNAIEYRWGNPGLVKPFNDAIGNGLFARMAAGETYDTLLHAVNAMKQLNLAGPAYHAISMAKEVIFGGIGNAIQELAGGEIGRGLADLGMSATFVPKLVQNTWQGFRGMSSYKALTNDPALNELVKAGARIGPRQSVYMTGTSPSLYETAARGGFNPFTNQWNLLGAVKQLGREIKTDFGSIFGDARNESVPDRIIKGVGYRWANFVGGEINRFLLQTITAPVMDAFIPAAKTGVNLERTRTFLRQNPGAAPEALSDRTTQIARNTDHRLGELNMDNLFWPRATKQVSQLAMISTGWVYGTYQFLMRGVGINPEMFVKGNPVFQWNPVATSNLVGAVIGEGLFNAAYQYAMTGLPPQEIKDLIAPRAADGKRVMLPGQVKELFDMAKIAFTTYANPREFLPAVGNYATGKLNALWHIGSALINRDDAIGRHVYYGPGGVGEWIKNQVKPIAESMVEQRKKGSGIPDWQTMLGVKPAPDFVNDPNHFFGVQDWLKNKWTKEALARARKDNAQLETPDPSIGMPQQRAHKTGDAAMDSYLNSPANRRNQSITRERVAPNGSAYIPRARTQRRSGPRLDPATGTLR